MAANAIYSPTPSRESLIPLQELQPFIEQDRSNTPSQVSNTSVAPESRPISPGPFKEESAVRSPSATLYRSSYVLHLALLYSILAVFSWILMCILAYRPITIGHYGFWNEDGQSFKFYVSNEAAHMRNFYVQNSRWYQTARVVAAIVAVVTIPLTSAVCSKAAVVYLQRPRRTGPSLRQMMTLADKGWTEPATYLRLLSGKGRRHVTQFLVFAIVLNILGGIIAPLQSVFVSSKTISTPAGIRQFSFLTDLADILSPYLIVSDRGLTVLNTRLAIDATSRDDPQARLWARGSTNCSAFEKDHIDKDHLPSWCGTAGIPLSNLTIVPDPFLAELPSRTSTGMIQQFVPRINSTASRTVLQEAEFPSNCEVDPGSFFVQYSGGSLKVSDRTWSLVACMPGNQSVTPWKSIRSRQDFSESLYLNLSVHGYGSAQENDTQSQGGLFKFTMDTTVGYFELPNFMNKQTPGPLLDIEPNCTKECIYQTYEQRDQMQNSRRRDAIQSTTNATLALTNIPNHGPLLNIALALFGNGSFIQRRVAYPAAFVFPNTNRSDFEEVPNVHDCTDTAPLYSLANSAMDWFGTSISLCLDMDYQDQEGLQEQLAAYVQWLYLNPYDQYDGVRITNAFSAAAFLANEKWLLSSQAKGLTVSYDDGVDTLIPTISLTGIIIISMLLAVYISALMGMAIYSACKHRWTDQLDAFAMMRIGAAISEHIDLRIANANSSHIKVLDDLPGWIGDATLGENQVGRLGLGSSEPLRERRKYESYHDEPTESTKPGSVTNPSQDE